MESTTSANTSKIVVGVALAAVFGTGAYIYGVRDAHQTQVAQAPAPIAAPPPAAAPAAPPADTPADQVVSAEGQVTPAQTPSVAQTDTAPAVPAPSDAAPVTPSKSDRHMAKRSSSSDSDSSSVSTADTAAAARNRTATGSSDTASSTADNSATPPPAPTAATPPAAPPVASTDAPASQAPAQDAAPAANPPAAQDSGNTDSKISNEVKTQIAAAAPNSNVNVTTTNGTVALNGSVPSQDVVNQAKQAALSVDGVKNVDTSGLMVASNN